MTRPYRLLAVALAIAINPLTFATSVFAAPPSVKRVEKRSEPGADSGTMSGPALAVQTKNGHAGKQYVPEELEALRAKFLELTDTVQQFTDLVAPEHTELTNGLTQARLQFERFTPKELNSFRETMNPAEMNNQLVEMRAALDEYRPLLEPHRQRVLQRLEREKEARAANGNVSISSANLPDRDGPDSVCGALVGSGRPSSALIIATDAIYFIAKGIHAASDRACNQVVVVVTVVAGEGGGGGGNTSAACVAADALLIAATVVRDKVSACNDDFTKRTIDGAFNRMGHLDSQLDSSIANDNTNKTTITTAISNSQGAIVANANGNTATLTTAISNTQTAIISNDDTNRNTIVANANANTATLKTLILHTQIEADLASSDSATFVALYMTPGAKGGFLELTRSIVVQTIANIAGSNTDQANALLAKGDAAVAAGDYKKAYSYFRLAYKKAEGQ